MPLQSREEIIAGDERLRTAAEADDGDGVFQPTETKVGCYCFGQNCYGDKDGIGCWWCVELAMEKCNAPSDEVEPGVCRFNCNVCKCICQVTFEESRRNQISNALTKNTEKTKPIETLESQREGGRSLFFNYVKTSLVNNSVRELQQVDYRSKNEIIQDVFTQTSIEVSHNIPMQCSPKVMRGLQEIIRGRRTNVNVKPTAGGSKTSMSIQQARNELKGQRKNPPEELSKNVPLASNFVSNAGSQAHRNQLSNVAIDPCSETVGMMTGNQTATLRSPMMERVQKRVFDKFLDAATTPQTKKVVAKVHTQLAHKDAAFTMVVERFQDIQSSQRILDACIDLQGAME
jgi:hypothetical protein